MWCGCYYIREYKLKHCDIVVKASFSYFCVTHTTPLSQLLLELHKSLTEFTCLSSSLFTSFSAAVSPHPSTTIYTFFSLKKNLFKRSWTHNRGLSSQLINNSWKKSPFFLILPPFFCSWSETDGAILCLRNKHNCQINLIRLAEQSEISTIGPGQITLTPLWRFEWKTTRKTKRQIHLHSKRFLLRNWNFQF